jgi:ATP-dependent 26S proteasome regulatory subunit
MNADQPRGRVAILNGEPGTGKTFLVRGLLNDIKDAVMVIVPANLVVQLAQPGMIPALVELHKDSGERPIIFLIEDADEVLATRMGDNMSAVSAVLNLGDGILGKLLDIRLICTTNAKHQDLDAAIMRPGRLSAHVSVDALPYEKAQVVYRRLLGAEAELPRHREYTLAEIYQMAFDKGWKPAKETKKVGFTSELEENDDGDDFDPYD